LEKLGEIHRTEILTLERGTMSNNRADCDYEKYRGLEMEKKSLWDFDRLKRPSPFGVLPTKIMTEDIHFYPSSLTEPSSPWRLALTVKAN
jgi:hypothetical protein